MIYFLLIINYIAIISDAVTDSGIDRKPEVNRLVWHLFKWMRIYIPELIIVFLLYHFELIIISKLIILAGVIYVCLGWALWLIFYNANILNGLYKNTVIELD